MRSLQWGRDHLIAEIAVACEGPVQFANPLQWGRDHLIAEIKPKPADTEQRVLQWGRDHLIAEM